MTPGKIYTFKYRSQNRIGFSDFSIEKRFAATLPPSKPAAPTKDMLKSTLTSIYVLWSESQPTQAAIIGYNLYMSEGTHEYELIYSNT